jgi:P27 family predicted phage terminase small subunit
MARPRQPANLIELKGRAHMSKDELQKRKDSEIRAPTDRVEAPKYLTKKQAEKFTELAEELLALEIMSNLDCDALARYIQSVEKYLKYDKLVNQTLSKASSFEKAAAVVLMLEKLEGLRDKAFKQCRAAASDLGLTISSRCKLVVPKLPDEKPQNKFKALSG